MGQAGPFPVWKVRGEWLSALRGALTGLRWVFPGGLKVLGEPAEASRLPGLGGGGRVRGCPRCGKIWSDDSEATWRPGMWVLDPQTTGGMWEELTPSTGRLPPTPAHSQP